MDKNKLREMLCKAEKEVQTARRKRGVKTAIGFTIAYFLGFALIEKIEPEKWLEAIAISAFLAVIHYAVNYAVFEHIFGAEASEEQMISALKKRIEES